VDICRILGLGPGNHGVLLFVGVEMSESFLDGKVTLLRGDCLELLPTLEADSIDSCVTDPPYHLTSIVKRFGKSNLERDDSNLQLPSNKGGGGTVSPYKRVSAGFMGQKWDGGDIAFRPELWMEVLRVLKPGAHLLAFSGTRTYHRMACAIEDAGFEIRDQIGWCYGSGFPKSHDVSKGIDRQAGAEREKVVTGKPVKRIIPGADQNKQGWEKNNGREYVPGPEIPATDSAIQWQGWGTALKPAWEPIVLARKPLSESSIAANVLKWGTGAINIDGCRIEPVNGNDYNHPGNDLEHTRRGRPDWRMPDQQAKPNSQGRWPANLIHDGSEEVLAGFPETQSGVPGIMREGVNSGAAYGAESRRPGTPMTGFGDSGSAARFFYTAKADADDRLGSKHPTVKPLDLLQYLVRLVTPKAGVVLDPFAGTGTAGEAAFREGLSAILVEREPEYQADIVRRMKLCLSGPDERARESIKASGKVEEAGPLFGGLA
jgi:DNA modification methylase